VDASTSDARFSGSIAELYERLLVPMIFQPFADRLPGSPPHRREHACSSSLQAPGW
jgi:hypothetical protein